MKAALNFRLFFAAAALFLGIVAGFSQERVMVSRDTVLMGTQFRITVADRDSSAAVINIHKAIDEIVRIENLISEWRPHTQISEVNRNAGIKPVKVDGEVFGLIRRAVQYSLLSGGAFDVSTAAMDRVWRFDGSMTRLPSEEEMKASVRNVNYRNIVLDSIQSTVFLSEKGMKIGFGSIGKGYAADRGRALLKSLGVEGGLVDASGDMSAWGVRPDGEPWTVGIRNPFKRHKMAGVLKLEEESVATSGNYEKFSEIDGVRYSHIINPKTGMPAVGLTSVTVYGPSAEFANALSTSVMVLGKKEGRRLLKKHPAYRFLLIEDSGKIMRR